MSRHFSKFDLNTYATTPYFRANLPKDYPLDMTLMKCRMFRKLPPHLKELSALAKRWANRVYGPPTTSGVEKWYSEAGFELNPNTGHHLTDKEINAEWDALNLGKEVNKFKVVDIPIPDDGFPDPDKWEEPPEEQDPPAPHEGPSEKDLLGEIKSFGRAYIVKHYGVPHDKILHVKSDEDLAHIIYNLMRGDRPLEEKPLHTELSIKEGDPPEVISAPEFEFSGIGEVTEAARGPIPADKEKKEKDEGEKYSKVGVVNDWDDLKSIVVGRIDNDVFAPKPWQPSVKGLPKKGGVSYKDFAPDQWKKAVQQLDNLTSVLEREGVKVHRPPYISLEEALRPPVGLTQVYVREAFTVIHDTVVLGQCRTPYRRKESRAFDSFFKDCKILRLPTVPDDIEDSEPDDPNPYIEGGDVFRAGKNVIITMSGLATSSTGFRFVSDHLSGMGIEAWPAELAPEFEHGDYILMLVREGLCLAYLKGFKDGLLPTPIGDWDVVNITKSEADPGMAANGIVLRENVVILPQGNRRVVRALEKKGVDVIEVPFDGVAYFQGAVDCATAELLREEPDAG